MAVDQTQLKTLQDIIGKETLQKVQRSYIEDSEPKLLALGDAIETGDFATIEQLSHSLKSASSNLALSGVAEVFAQLEALATQQQTSQLAALYQAAQASYHQEVAELDALLNN